MTEIEHQVHRGKLYVQGIGGQKIAIVGYSHWTGTGADNIHVTQDVIAGVLNGEHDQFFTKIRNYFGFADHRDFWKRVLFFNYLPTTVGPAGKRYAGGTGEQIEHAQSRLKRILQQHRPQKIFVFTQKGWSQFPETEQEETGKRCAPLSGFPKFDWGTYRNGKSAAFGLRHPQGANGRMMTAAVHAILKMSVQV